MRSEREELLAHVQEILEPVMTVLGFVFLGLLLLEYSSLSIAGLSRDRIGQALQVIWAVFLLDFSFRFAIAPAKLTYLRQNWLGALSLALPFLRPLRAFRAARALRSISLVRLLGGINRGMRVLRQVTRGRQIAYIAALTVIVVLTGAVGVLYFERDVAGAPVRSFGDALWWSATLVTTMNSEKYVVSTEARLIAVLQRLFALSVFGYVTASIASYLIGSAQTATGSTGEDVDIRAELAAIRRELALLRETSDVRRES